MNFIELIDDNNLVSDDIKNLITNLLISAAEYEKIDIEKTELSVSFVSKEEIHSINKEYRGFDKPTDVISFALNDETDEDIKVLGLEEDEDINALGDIILCVDIAKEQAIEYNHSFEREIGFLSLHGFLHLLGYDHIEKEDEIVMFSKQDDILENFGLHR